MSKFPSTWKSHNNALYYHFRGNIEGEMVYYISIHTYTVYTPIGGKGRCCTRRDLQDHRTQARKSAGERSTPDLKPVSRTHKVQNRSNQWLHKLGLGPTKKLKKKKNALDLIAWELTNGCLCDGLKVNHRLLSTHEVESPARDPSEGVPTASGQVDLINYVPGHFGI